MPYLCFAPPSIRITFSFLFVRFPKKNLPNALLKNNILNAINSINFFFENNALQNKQGSTVIFGKSSAACTTTTIGQSVHSSFSRNAIYSGSMRSCSVRPTL